ncbi:MAG TPA: hypothetical protein VK165_05845 [Azonexus sp.]|nr:hypothetical protein [Azonexus sp.]
MSSVLGVTTSPLSINTSYPVAPASALGAPQQVNLFAPGLLGGRSTVVELSGLGQVLSAATAFQEQLAVLQPGTATSGGGQNFGNDLASLSAEAQSFVDAFNNLQSNIANGGVGSPFGGGSALASRVASALDTAVQGNFANDSSALGNLEQIGIVFQPAQLPGGSNLSIDLAKLKSAFQGDPKGSFSLLAQAAISLGRLAGDYVTQVTPQVSGLRSLVQTLASSQFADNSLLLLSRTNGDSNLADLLALEMDFSNGQRNAYSPTLRQSFLAMSQFNLVSTLLG